MADADYKNELVRIKSQFETNKSILVNRAPAVVLGIQDAQNAVTTAKAEIESGISTLQSRDMELKSKLQALLRENEQSASKIKMLETQNAATKQSVKEAETLAALRKEQADELRRKGEGNFHSSWMGLWRPLSEQSQFGLIIASVFFGIVSLIFIFLYAKQLFPVIAAYFATLRGGADNSYLPQIGSGRERRRH